MIDDIAIVGLACRFPEASSPAELWENVLAQRRSFRRIPSSRLRAADYLVEDPAAPDAVYSWWAALLEGYEFDRLRFRISGPTFRATDLTHWLALEVAADCLVDAGYPAGDGLPRQTTAVVVGNSLTGEITRASTLRLRWPFVRRVVGEHLRATRLGTEDVAMLLASIEGSYKAPFPPVGEDSLVGALSNAIAGRICNHFDLNGGGYTVDGACASSLLAVTTVCTQLASGDIDVGLAGGVDISIDPFELVGFAKTGALAAEEMRVYDRRSAGFWPGEGCGFAVLMRGDDARAEGRRIYGYIRGWGVSSDGAGGITRPEVAGQKLALARAYRRARVDVESVAYLEGHGTGTAVGDSVELTALSEFRREGGATTAAVVGSVKANIGHTKAAAGVAGLIKTAMALHHRTVPPNTACDRPHPLLAGADGPLTFSHRAQSWPTDRPWAGVSGTGFGGINTHVVLEAAARAVAVPDGRVRLLERTAQDLELFAFPAADRLALGAQLRQIRARASHVSWGELGDLAATLADGGPAGDGGREQWRVAVLARTPTELVSRLEAAERLLEARTTTHLDPAGGVFVGPPGRPPRLGFLFPGQGVAASRDGGAWTRRFDAAARRYGRVERCPDVAVTATTVSQPAIATAALVGLAVLERLGITAELAVGHSMGELCAYTWAGALPDSQLLGMVQARAAAIESTCAAETAMAGVDVAVERLRPLLLGTDVVIAAMNAEDQVVVAGSVGEVSTVMHRARLEGLRAVRLPVAHAFHSPFMAEAARRFEVFLATAVLYPIARPVVSTVTGSRLSTQDDLRQLLVRQLTAPVHFAQAVGSALDAVDAFVEVGPGRVLTGLVGDRAVCLPLDVGGESLHGLLACVGAAHALGVGVRTAPLFADRAVRPFQVEGVPVFITNPCETVPADVAVDMPATECASAGPALGPTPVAAAGPDHTAWDILGLVRTLVAARTELVPSVIDDGHRLLDDLHLSSVTVGQIVQETLEALGLSAAGAPTSFANATVGELARAITELAAIGPSSFGGREVEGIGPWVRAFEVGSRRARFASAPSDRRPVGSWSILASADAGCFAADLQTALSATTGGSGVGVYLRPGPVEEDIELLVRGARQAISSKVDTFVVVQHDGVGSAFARSLAMEHPGLNTCVVDVPATPAGPGVAELVAVEASRTRGLRHVLAGADGILHEPVLVPVGAARKDDPPALSTEDVVLVIGGGKGIGAECALGLASAFGPRLALLGRSRPGADALLDATLDRMGAAGVAVSYESADVTDDDSVRRALGALQRTLGPVTAVLHSAGTNTPTAVASLELEQVRSTVAPKVKGLRHVLAALDGDRLALLVAFGSLIARTGFRGEAHYGLANEWLALEVERFARTHPGCRCLTLEWSVWAGTGMGDRLGAVEAMAREGIDPLPVRHAVGAMVDVLSRPDLRGPIVVSGRFGAGAAPLLGAAELPLLRFLERPLLHYPGIELVVENDLLSQTDHYLDDHVLDANPLMPAAVCLEALAHAATALVATPEAADLAVASFHDVAFASAIVVPPDGTRVLRLAAQVGDDGVEVAVRSDGTGFHTDHVRARCRLAPPASSRARAAEPPSWGGAAPDVDVERDLYGSLLFQSGRFRRLLRYRSLGAASCVAEVASRQESWFSPFLPDRLLLGDPGVRDAALHCVQACLPHLPVLPVSVGAIALIEPWAEGVLVVDAREKTRSETVFTYDIEISTLDGFLCERWSDVVFRASARPRRPCDVPPSLLGVVLERSVQDIIDDKDIRLVLVGGGRRGESSNAAFARIVEPGLVVTRAATGEPSVRGYSLSASHAGEMTMAVAAPGPVACDIEMIHGRSEAEWRTLLGPRWSLVEAGAGAAGLSSPAAGAMVWAAIECLVKAGLSPTSRLELGTSPGTEGWLVLSSAGRRIAVTALEGAETLEIAVAVLGGRRDR